MGPGSGRKAEGQLVREGATGVREGRLGGGKGEG